MATSQQELLRHSPGWLEGHFRATPPYIPKLLAPSRRAVRSIRFNDDVPVIFQLVTVLGACTGLRNLVLNVSLGPEGLQALSHLNQLCRLELVADGINLLYEDPAPVFPCITHLKLMVSKDRSEADYSDLEKLPRLFPRLTHFAHCSPPTQPAVNVLQRAYAQMPLPLECIVFLSAQSLVPKKALFPEDDPRFVCVVFDIDYRLDWLRGADTGDDYWRVVDGFIKAKRAGVIDRTCTEVVLSAYEYVAPPQL
ncbi:hypothetical protein B0H16DRAFT_1713066 [Mycena metata]|uniref:Uncharacterized protein n=1 Tax=Mycena metata TaxID=1033252 RepID=A0AAD7NTP5_9AGAR|nr:hypothetical protein B0H16DRAFT_1713066 [Mycena metata]